MSTLKEMAQEYRAAAAKLAMRIKEKRDAGAPEAEIRSLSAALQDIRAAQRELDGYYTVPRSDITSAGWKARGVTKDDH